MYICEVVAMLHLAGSTLHIERRTNTSAQSHVYLDEGLVSDCVIKETWTLAIVEGGFLALVGVLYFFFSWMPLVALKRRGM